MSYFTIVVNKLMKKGKHSVSQHPPLEFHSVMEFQSMGFGSSCWPCSPEVAAAARKKRGSS